MEAFAGNSADEIPAPKGRQLSATLETARTSEGWTQAKVELCEYRSLYETVVGASAQKKIMVVRSVVYHDLYPETGTLS